GGDSGPVFVAKSGDAELLRRIANSNTDERMPPEGPPLAATEIDAVRRWLAAGANWPETEADRAAERDPRRDHWAWKPLTRPTVPQPNEQDAKRIRTPVDAFIVAKLRERDLAPSPEADARTLVRRVYFDL